MTTTVDVGRSGVKTKRKKKSMTRQVMKRFIKNRTAVVGLIILLLLILIAVFAPVLAPYSPTEMDLKSVNSGPSLQHLFGCDGLGRDIMSRLMYGARYSLSLGFISALAGAVLGVIVGALAGYAGGHVDNIVMRIMDIWSSIPGMLLAIVISTTLGPGLVNTILAMTVGHIPGSARTTRAMCLKERELEYLEAAQSINCRRASIVFKHMLPNIISPTIVSTTVGIGSCITEAAGLAYIGLGVQPPDPEWGAMLSAGRKFILNYPHLLFFPGLCIAITVLAINLMGDGLRDALDPKLKK